MHKDYMSMYFCYATSTNAWDYKKAKLDFKKNKKYATILVENQAALTPEIQSLDATIAALNLLELETQNDKDALALVIATLTAP